MGCAGSRRYQSHTSHDSDSESGQERTKQKKQRAKRVVIVSEQRGRPSLTFGRDIDLTENASNGLRDFKSMAVSSFPAQGSMQGPDLEMTEEYMDKLDDFLHDVRLHPQKFQASIEGAREIDGSAEDVKVNRMRL
mmetsp:Transcript_68460/g.164391  ORF Transcript_68460/g.164391 Transcript_68460/m.164391 type:complete len:135 (-) Transcript_68460:165-569(-)